MTFKYRYRKQIIIGVFLLVVLITIGVSITMYYSKYEKKEPEEEIIVKKEDTKKDKEEDTKEQEMLKVDIKGEIMYPGIYSLIESSRVIDVIELAGGLTEYADTSVINLSKKIKDEMVIIVYSHDQVANFIKTKEQENYLQNKCHESDENSLTNDACITENEQVTGLININYATLEELMTLKGIGEAKAQDIITYREANGGFNNIEEIMNIPGIGESIYAKIKENITT